MISKILSFLSVYILTLINFSIILSPFCMFLIFNNKILIRNLKSLFFLFVFIESFLMLILFIFNYIFDTNVNYYKKKFLNCSNSKDDKFKRLNTIFGDIKDTFNKDNVCLLIQNSKEINAYAVGGLRKNCIILTTGIMELCKKNSKDEIEYYRLLSGIISHEMSHIINKDFFTGLFVLINEKVNRISLFFIFILFRIISNIFKLIPFIGIFISEIFSNLYIAIKRITNFFYKNIFIPIYRFIQLQISKEIEYRADKQGAMYCGGKTMSNTLSLLGNSGNFFTIFSTHPKTQNRVKKVKNVKQVEEICIKPIGFANLNILISIFLLIFFTFISYKHINFNDFFVLYELVLKYINLIKYKIKYLLYIMQNKY